jgi:hypothetical protein
MLETGPENGAAPEGLTLAPAGAAQAAGTVAPADAEDAESDELLACFGAGTLPERRFHHRDHVQVAWLLLDRHPPLAAIELFCRGLRRLAAAFGKAGLYHETITWAYLLLVHERRERLRLAASAPPVDGATVAVGAPAPAAPPPPPEPSSSAAPAPPPPQPCAASAAVRWQEFAARNADLLTWQPSILAAYYREETLASDLARQVFVLPDRMGGAGAIRPVAE